jgi:Sulfotransferase family
VGLEPTTPSLPWRCSTAELSGRGVQISGAGPSRGRPVHTDRAVAERSPENIPERYFFVHIMKTGGTALVQRLRHHFGDAIYPTVELDGTDVWEQYLLIDRLREQLAARGDQIRLVAGHFPLCTSELLEGRFKTITLLREPVERMLSFLQSMRRDSLDEAHDEFMPRALDALNWHPALDPTNNMTRMLAMTPEELERSKRTRIPATGDHLKRAKEALTGMGAIGVQERFEGFCSELTTRFGWDLGARGRANVSPSVEASESLRARITEANSLDIELYAFAMDLVRERSGKAGRGTLPG